MLLLLLEVLLLIGGIRLPRRAAPSLTSLALAVGARAEARLELVLGGVATRAAGGSHLVVASCKHTSNKLSTSTMQPQSWKQILRLHGLTEKQVIL